MKKKSYEHLRLLVDLGIAESLVSIKCLFRKDRSLNLLYGEHSIGNLEIFRALWLS